MANNGTHFKGNRRGLNHVSCSHAFRKNEQSHNHRSG